MFIYTVRCQFESQAEAVAREWLAWLREEHLADVCNAGARSARVMKIDAALPSFEIEYEFDSRESFDAYETNHAPRLRAEGLRRFPLELGLAYTRQTGELVENFRLSHD